MKKLLGIVVLGLLLSSSGFAKTIYNNATCVKGNCMNGEGVLNFPNGKKYTGSFKKGLFNGSGSLIWDNYKYNGEYKNGKRNGYGKMIYDNGAIYEGNYKDSKYHGEGFFSQFGNTYKGSYENGEYHGQGVLTFPSGVVEKGQFIKSKFIRKVEKIGPKSNSIILPVQINIVQVNKGNLISITTNETIEGIKADINYANYLWKDAGYYFKIIDIKNTDAVIPKDFQKKIKWMKNTSFKKSNGSDKLVNYTKKLFNHKKYRNKKAINVYYYLPDLLQPKGRKCGWASIKSKKDRWFVIPFAYRNCPLQSWGLGHELGHVLGILHVGKEGKDLMAEKGWGKNIPLSEVSTANKFYEKHLKHFK